MRSREHFQVWTRAVSSTSSVNRVAVSSTRSHLTVTLSSLFMLESNSPVQALVRFRRPAVSSTSTSSDRCLCSVCQGTADFQLMLEKFRFSVPGTSPPSDSSPSQRNFVAFHRLSREESSSLPLLSCFGEQNTPHLADKTPSISALSFGN